MDVLSLHFAGRERSLAEKVGSFGSLPREKEGDHEDFTELNSSLPGGGSFRGRLFLLDTP